MRRPLTSVERYYLDRFAWAARMIAEFKEIYPSRAEGVIRKWADRAPGYELISDGACDACATAFGR